MNLFYQPLLPKEVNYLDAEESRHCVKVLRYKSGDWIDITDGQGCFYKAVIIKADQQQCLFEVQEKKSIPAKNFLIHIAISPTKNADRIEWFVEKSVEFGIDKITLLNCENTERSYIKIERLEKVAISAMKQSLKASLPSIEKSEFSQIVQQENSGSKFIAFVDHKNPDHLKDLAKANASYLVLIGPEGDFSMQELVLAINNGFQKVSLGASRLRTETAGVAACHVLNLLNTAAANAFI